MAITELPPAPSRQRPTDFADEADDFLSALPTFRDEANALAEDTNANEIATAADRVQTGLDAQATAADRVQTGLDAIATAADRVQTGLDATATAADRVQTGLDAQATAADVITAQEIIDDISVAPLWVSGTDYDQYRVVTDPTNFKTYKATVEILNSTTEPNADTNWQDISFGGTASFSNVEFTATAGQTVFTVDYTVGLVDVFLDGVKLGSVDVDVSSGTSVVLTEGATVGALLVVQIFTSFNIANTYTKTEIDASFAEVEARSYLINKPSITSPTNGQTDFIGTITSSSFSSGDYYTNSQDYVYWKLALDSGLTNIVDEYSGSSNLNSWAPAYGNNPLTTMYAEVRYGSEGHLSEKSDIISFTTSNIYVETPTITVEGSPTDVPENPEISTSAFSVVNGSGTHASTSWKVTDVLADLVVWQSLNDETNLLSVTMPKEILVVSKEYKFEAQHNSTEYGSSAYGEATATTKASFFYHGVGPGASSLQYDSSTDTGYYGETTTAELITGSDLAASIGLIEGTSINDTAGWLKFQSHGKVLYIAKKPQRHTVSWDQIYWRSAVYGDRTIRIGNDLYKVRLMTGATSNPIDTTNASGSDSCSYNLGGSSEWNELMYRIHQDAPVCGTDTYDGGAQVGSNWASFTDADIVVAAGDGRYTWTQETASDDLSRRVGRGYDRLSYFSRLASSNASASYGWRPCLELIQPGSEPYNTIDDGPGPSTLTYDSVTDTGYYGETTTTELTTGSALASSIGLSAGTSINDTAGWLKFYYHGKVLYIAKKPQRHTVSWDNVYTAGAVHGFGSQPGGDSVNSSVKGVYATGSTSPGNVVQTKEITVGAYELKVRLMTGATSNPIDTTNASGSDSCSYNLGGSSEWNELMYRIHQDAPVCGTDTYDGGAQVGSNWASFTDADIVVAAGDGRYTWTQETASDDLSRRVRRGYVRLSYFNRDTSSDANATYGWRPCLELKR